MWTIPVWWWCPAFLTPWTAAPRASLSLTISQSLPKFMSIASVMLSSHLILWCPLVLPSIFPVSKKYHFSNELTVHIRWLKYWSFSFSLSPSNVYSGLISLKIDWFDLLAVQGTVRSLLQHDSVKASVLRHSAFFTVQLSQLSWPLGRQPWLWTFVGRVMSLLFNTLSRFVLAFLPRSQRLLISWLQWFQWVITYYYHCLYWWLLLSLVWPVGALSGCLHVSTCHVSSFLGTFLLSGSVMCCRLILYFESSWISHDSF